MKALSLTDEEAPKRHAYKVYERQYDYLASAAYRKKTQKRKTQVATPAGSRAVHDRALSSPSKLLVRSDGDQVA